MYKNIDDLLSVILFNAYQQKDALKAIKLKVLYDDIKEKYSNTSLDIAINYYEYINKNMIQ